MKSCRNIPMNWFCRKFLKRFVGILSKFTGESMLSERARESLIQIIGNFSESETLFDASMLTERARESLIQIVGKFSESETVFGALKF